MAPRRRNFRRKNRRQKKGMAMTKFRIRKKASNVYNYVRNVNLSPVLAVADGSDILNVYSFLLSDVPGYTEFTALYDFYRINAIQIKFLPYFSQVNQDLGQVAGVANTPWGITSSANNLRVFSAIDYNATAAPASINAIREYKNCRMSKYTRGHKRFFKPKILIVTGSSNAITEQGRRKPWISVTPSGEDEPHYALIFGIDTSLLPANVISPNDVMMRIECKYYIQFKSVK